MSDIYHKPDFVRDNQASDRRTRSTDSTQKTGQARLVKCIVTYRIEIAAENNGQS